ncbi:hypothetical protein ACVILH_003492 [Bradyrhizobium sp. USDA 4353]
MISVKSEYNYFYRNSFGLLTLSSGGTPPRGGFGRPPAIDGHFFVS